MMRSMFSAISGLKNHQLFMDVIGNNIANVNTTGFKQSRVTFQDILSQTVRDGSSPQPPRSGTNPAQVGLGTVIASVDTVQTQGTFQASGKNTDMAIQGDGYFIMDGGANGQVYTRDGAFDIGLDGSLNNPSNGLRVVGWQADAAGVVNTAGALTTINIPIGQGMENRVSTTATVTGNLNQDPMSSDYAASNSAGGPLSVTGTSTSTAVAITPYRITLGDAAQTGGVNATTGAATAIRVQKWTGAGWGDLAGTAGAYTDLTTNTFTDAGQTFTVAAARGNRIGDMYYTNAKASDVTLYDSLGEPYAVRTVLQKTPAFAAGVVTGPRDWQTVSSVQSAATPPAVARIQTGANNLVFDASGKVATGGTGTIALTTAGGTITNGAADMAITVDFSAITQFSGTSDIVQTTNGAQAGTLSTFSIGQSGDVTGIYSNGLKRTLGTIALASFQNPAGLVKQGGNVYSLGTNSGNPRVGTPNTNGRGTVATGFLEASNVDLAQQFTDMIRAERGFQANSRVISTSDNILQELVNLKR